MTDTATLDEVPELLKRYHDLEVRLRDLNGMIDRAGQRGLPQVAREREENRAEVEQIRAKLESSGWPPTAPLAGE